MRYLFLLLAVFCLCNNGQNNLSALPQIVTDDNDKLISHMAMISIPRGVQKRLENSSLLWRVAASCIFPCRWEENVSASMRTACSRLRQSLRGFLP